MAESIEDCLQIIRKQIVLIGKFIIAYDKVFNKIKEAQAKMIEIENLFLGATAVISEMNELFDEEEIGQTKEKETRND